MVPKTRISPWGPAAAMAMGMESLWTARPRWSLIAFMVWLSVRIQLMNQNASPAYARTFVRLCPLGQSAIPMNGNPTALINPLTHGRLWPVSHKV